MGITPITDASGLMDQLMPGAAPVQTANSGSDFKTIWSDQAANSANAADKISTYVAKDSAASDNRQDVKTGDDRNTVKATGSRKDTEASQTDVKGTDSPDETGKIKAQDNAKTGGVLKDEDIESAQEVLASQIAELVQKITEILGIEPEEFENLLQASGIDKMQLLDGEVLSDFMVQALGADSRLALLTDEAGYDQFNQAMEALNEILGKDSGIADLNVGELKELVSDVLEKQGNDIPAEEVVPEVKTEKTETVRYERDSNGNFIRTDVNESGSEVGQATLVAKAEKPGDQKNASGDSKNNTGSEHMTNASQVFDDIKPEGDVQVQAPAYSYTENVNEIAEQILDHMKTVTDGDYSDVEMQLHPASLGTLQIHVTNNAGVMTASFVTENEAVRSAVESQMVRLIEQFETQGIKIEAVEVTVASHAFEQGNDAGRSNESGEGSQKRSRRINLGDLTDDSQLEDMEEDEKIAAEMMAANGNTVDFMA